MLASRLFSLLSLNVAPANDAARLVGGSSEMMFALGFAQTSDAQTSKKLRSWALPNVAGVTLAAGKVRKWRVRVPGHYKADAAIIADGIRVPAGRTIILRRGLVTLWPPPVEATGLLWGKDTMVSTTHIPQRP